MASVLRQVPTDAAWDVLPDFAEDPLLCGEDDARRAAPHARSKGSVKLTGPSLFNSLRELPMHAAWCPDAS